MTLAHGYSDTNGGAISATSASCVFLSEKTIFFSNSAEEAGGAIYAVIGSTVSWDGDTAFSSNYGGFSGGAVHLVDSTVSWNGNTAFSNNTSETNGGAIYLKNSTVSWDGNTTFSNNTSGFNGAAIYASASSTVSWVGGGTQFYSNDAARDGGAIYVASSLVSWNGRTTFSDNSAGENGGALGFFEIDSFEEPFADAIFTKNSAATGGALYSLNCLFGFTFTGAVFESNSASGAGGAVAAYVSGESDTSSSPVTFTECIFSDNVSNGTGGAVETLAGVESFNSCDFTGNSADIGGALRLGGTADVQGCNFVSNDASSRGLAVAVVGSASIAGSSFNGNELICASGSYREDVTEDQGESTARYEIVCLDCPGFEECSNCTIERGGVTPACASPLEHTAANEDGVTLETLTIAGGYWRATSDSTNILDCYHADACLGGKTGSDSYCAPGYGGPYCSVCEPDYSPSFSYTCTQCSSSRRQGLLAAIVIVAIVAAFATVAIFKSLLSAELQDSNMRCFHGRVRQAVPVQALKIIVVVWQILTQFAAAANTSYPGVYQDFLDIVSVINFDLGSVLAAGCVWSDMDFHDRLLVNTTGPLVVVGFLTMTYWIAMRRNSESESSVVEKIRHKHQTALLLLTFLIYSSVSSTVFQTFSCETLDDEIEYLRADYSILCTDAKHKAFEAYAGIMVFVYPVGIPLLYAVLLFQRRHVLSDAGADKAVAQSISGLWEPYRPERFYYEVVECVRRVMLTGVVVFIFPNDAAQIAITMLIAFSFLIVFEVLSPYTSESDIWLSRVGHVIIHLSMFDLLLLKVDVSQERDQSQAAFAGVLVASHVLMILAIVVEAVGICYASTRKQDDEATVMPERPRAGSDEVPQFESAPAPWRSFMRQGSVLEMPGPNRSVAEKVVSEGRP
ncbi:unnamed protein product [Ectocarpus sp. 4 AP-2014]